MAILPLDDERGAPLAQLISSAPAGSPAEAALNEPPGFFMAEANLSHRASVLLNSVISLREVTTLREALTLDHARLARWVHRLDLPQVADEIARSATSHLQRAQSLPNVPEDPEAVEAWAAEQQITADLDTPIDELLPFVDQQTRASLYGAHLTVREILIYATTPSRVPSMHATRVRAVARAWLARTARAASVPPTALPQNERLAKLVRQIDREHNRQHKRNTRSSQQVKISFQKDPPLFRLNVQGDWQRGLYPATVSFDAVEPTPSTCSCNHPAERCPHRAPALTALRSLLCEAGNPAVVEMADWLALPTWERALRALERVTISADDTEAVLSWRIRDDVLLAVEPYLHVPRKNGKLSAGSRIGAEKRQSLVLPDHERRVMELLERDSHPNHALQTYRALELLIGHPRLVLADEPDMTVVVRRARLELALVLDEDRNVRAVPTLDGDEAAAQEFLRATRTRNGRLIGWLRREKRECLLVEISESQFEILAVLARSNPIFPPEAQPALLERLGALERMITVRLPAELAGETVAADTRLLLRLRLRSPGVSFDAFVQPLRGGPIFPPGEGPSRTTALYNGGRRSAERDLDAEKSRAREILTSLPLATALEQKPFSFDLMSDEAALDLAAHLRDHPREDLVVEWPADRERLSVTRAASSSDLRVVVEQGRDWFGLKGDVNVDGQKVALADLLAAVRRGERYVRIGERGWMALSAELRQRLAPAAEAVYESRAGLEVGPTSAAAVETLAEGAGEFEACKAWRVLQKRFATAQTFEPKVPTSLRAKLRPYQRDGFLWLMRLAEWGVGACLADDMGLGKTVQALAVLLARAKLGPALVVAPTSIGFNWVREAQRFAPSLNVRLYSERDRAGAMKAMAGEVIVMSYGLLARDAAQLSAVRFATLVLDEAHAVKNAGTRRARAARDLNADWRFALTGTPMENRLGELWSLFRVLTPGLLGSWEQFRERYAAPIEREKDSARRAALANMIRPFILRRTKDQVAPELPPRTEITVGVDLSADERKLYEDARLLAAARVAGLVDGGSDQARFQVLAEILRLRQLACHPRLLDPESTVTSSKLTEFEELLEELTAEGHRALVFSQFTSHLALVRQALDARGIDYRYLDGATAPEERERQVDRFQRGEGACFLISLKAGGMGLNLTGADYVIHLDPWWNPAVEDQATGRAHRIGQDKPVTVYRLVARGTIEEGILALHNEKRDLVAGVLDGADSAGKLTTAQLAALIQGGETGPREA